MTRRSIPCRQALAPTARAALAAALVLPLLANSAFANPGPQIDVTGHVAPRCWIANPASLRSALDGASINGRAMCNQATPMIQSAMREINADGTLASQMQSSARPVQFGGRAAMEITISPQL